MAENKKRFRIEFTVDMDCWSNDNIKDFALQELTCMSPYPEDITFSEVGSNWHTGTPQEDGEYLVWTTGDLPLIVTKNAHGIWEDDYYGYQKVREEDIVAWQKITPFEGEEVNG